MSTQTLVPITDPNRGWRSWYIDEIYGHGGRHVPNKNDMVISWTEGILRVVEVDYSTGRSIMEPANLPEKTGVETDGAKSDILLGAGPGRQSESYRIYINAHTTPYSLSFDRRLRVYGSVAKHVKVIQGVRIEGGEVISRFYDQQGQLVSDAIPLEVVGSTDLASTAIKTPMRGHCSKALRDGEPVTAVFYDDAGNVISTAVLLVMNTEFIRDMHAAVKYITSIELESPFLDEADKYLLRCPINIPMQAIHMRGVVNYSNGERKVLPIDGTKFSVFGLKQFVSTKLGQRQPISLVYRLSEGEISAESLQGDGLHMSQRYTATTVKVDGAYSIKLFSYPTWIDGLSGYRLVHYLYTLERDEVYDVTHLVEIAANSPAFDPTAYGVQQELTFAVDLSRVSTRFKNYRHLQTTKITLLGMGVENRTRWLVGYEPTQPQYGEGLLAKVQFINSNLWKLKVDNDFGSMEHWLREVYDKTYALYDPTSEAEPPVPNYFRIIAGTFEMECPVSMWNHEFTLHNSLRQGENVYLQFFRRDHMNDWQLATAAMSMRQIN